MFRDTRHALVSALLFVVGFYLIIGIMSTKIVKTIIRQDTQTYPALVRSRPTRQAYQIALETQAFMPGRDSAVIAFGIPDRSCGGFPPACDRSRPHGLRWTPLWLIRTAPVLFVCFIPAVMSGSDRFP